MFSFNLVHLCQGATRIIALLAITAVFVMFTAANNPFFALSHSKLEIVPCDIKLVFGVDDNGMSLVSYDLEMQISNRQGRVIRGISVHWLDSSAKMIGNSDALCGQGHNGIRPAQSGPCRRVVQRISGRLLDRLGQDTWTKIINSEMTNFREVRQCAIIGYRFGDKAIKSY
ncbi:hypothetical protein N8Z70_03170 [Candidatus Puniceispirillum sp.]|nr:hypothetical protein [Candidatus Puniceispirillum sp.]